MPRSRPTPTPSTADLAVHPPPGPDVGTWQLADGVLFSVLSSLVLWSVLFTSIYHFLD